MSKLSNLKRIGFLTAVMLIAISPSALAQSNPYSKNALKKSISNALSPHFLEEPAPVHNPMPPIDSGIENPVYHAPKKTDVQFQKSTPPTVKQFFSFLKQKSGKSSEQLKQDISKMINKQLNRGITLRELPPCLGYRTGVAPAKRMADETGYFDMVFYNPSDQKQVDYASSLGSIMIPYIAGNKVKATQRFRDANSPRAALAPLLGISCLPARLRKLKHKSINFLRLEEGLPPKLTAKGKKKVEELRKKNFMAAKANAEKEAAEKKAATEKQAIPKSAR